MFVYTYAHTQVHTHACMHTIHTYIYIHVHTHTCTHMFIYTHMSAHTFMSQKRVCVVGEGWRLSLTF